MSFPSLVAYGGDDSDSEPEPMDTDDQDKYDQDGEALQGKNVRKESELWDDEIENDEQSDEASAKTESPDEPPPPPGHNNRRNTPPSVNSTSNFQKVSSMISLVGYQGEEDSFGKYENEPENSTQQSSDESGSSNRSTARISPEKLRPHDSDETRTREPRPPERQSYDDEDAIDQIIREGQEAVIEAHIFMEERSPGSASPMPGPIEDKDYAEGPEKEDGLVELPADADDDPDPEVMERFIRNFEKKANGAEFNRYLQNSRTFTNPSGYVIIKEKFNIDERGTNFPKALFDPNMFPEDCYYDKLAEVQNRMMETLQKR